MAAHLRRREADAALALRTLAQRGFDLTREIPVRMTLLRTGSQQFRLGIVLHHIAADGWSLIPLTRDLAMAYAAAHPERTRALVLCGAEVKEETTTDWPWGEQTRDSCRTLPGQS